MRKKALKGFHAATSKTAVADLVLRDFFRFIHDL
jgi:hypothetical protein